MKIIIFLTLAMTLSIFSNAQSDEKYADRFIVCTNGDTLFGNLKMKKNIELSVRTGNIKVTFKDKSGAKEVVKVQKRNLKAFKNKYGHFEIKNYMKIRGYLLC